MARTRQDLSKEELLLGIERYKEILKKFEFMQAN